MGRPDACIRRFAVAVFFATTLAAAVARGQAKDEKQPKKENDQAPDGQQGMMMRMS